MRGTINNQKKKKTTKKVPTEMINGYQSDIVVKETTDDVSIFNNVTINMIIF